MNYRNQRFRRIIERPHLRAYWEDTFYGYTVQQDRMKGPQVLDYLESALELIAYTQYLYSQCFALRFDLRFPRDAWSPAWVERNEALQAFLDHLSSELEQASGKHSRKLHYLWARELNDQSRRLYPDRAHCVDREADLTRPHYHLLIILNRDSFNALGHIFPTRHGPWAGNYADQCLAHHIQRAWSWALDNRPHERMPGLVEFAKDLNGSPISFTFRRQQGPAGLKEVMYVASYLCKAYSKDFAASRCFQRSSAHQGFCRDFWATLGPDPRHLDGLFQWASRVDRAETLF